MPNPLFESLSKGASPLPMPRMPGPMAMMQQFSQFCSMFRGDPKKEVERLLSTGQMSQSQYNQLQDMARNFMPLLQRR